MKLNVELKINGYDNMEIMELEKGHNGKVVNYVASCK
jgi:hypothetical protein